MLLTRYRPLTATTSIERSSHELPQQGIRWVGGLDEVAFHVTLGATDDRAEFF